MSSPTQQFTSEIARVWGEVVREGLVRMSYHLERIVETDRRRELGNVLLANTDDGDLWVMLKHAERALDEDYISRAYAENRDGRQAEEARATVLRMWTNLTEEQ